MVQVSSQPLKELRCAVAPLAETNCLYVILRHAFISGTFIAGCAYRPEDALPSIILTTPVMLSSYAEMEDAVGNEEWERINQPEVRKRVQNRLSQRRHSEYPKTFDNFVTRHPVAEYLAIGEKLRQQREPTTQEIIIPSSFNSSYPMDGTHGLSDYPSPSLSFNGQDDRNDLPRSNQPQEVYDNFDSFSAQDMLPPDQTVSNVMAQHAPPGSVGMSRSMTPHMGRSAMNNVYQPNNMRHMGSLASGAQSLPGDSRNEFWDSPSLSDSQWAIPSFAQNSAPVCNPRVTTNHPRPASRHMHRPIARPMPRRMSNASSNQQMNAPPTPRTVDSHPSPVVQRTAANQTYPRSSSRLETAKFEVESTESNNDACSHCHTCRAPHTVDDQRPGRTSPKTPTSTPSRESSQASSPDHLEILANCSKVLADLARQSEFRDENEPEQRSRSSKRNKSNQNGYFVDGGGSSQEDDDAKGHRRHNRVEKVLILCVKNGRKTKGK